MVAHSPACFEPGCRIPPGRCHCGCGARTALALHTEPSKHRVAGTPHLFKRGHNPRPDRGATYTIDEAGCWIWQLALDRHGYGQWKVGKRNRLAHRAMYEQHIGPISDGMTLDHLCNVRACVNPDHLEPVPFAENIRRRGTIRSRSGE